MTNPGPWWRDAVVYEVYVRSFADSGGDGVGDLEGIRQHLPHLVSLGVDAVWLTPFYPSPMHDHGYDVADYCDVEPVFGTLADFDRLLASAHEAGLRVIVDVVPNHTSSQHVWFQEALGTSSASSSEAARARYVFRDGLGPDGDEPPNNWQSLFGGPAWTRESPTGQWYLHLFDSQQPDLEWTNPEVHQEMLRVLRFWLDRGVDGFRIDVAHALYKHPTLQDAPPGDDSEGLHAWDREEVLAVYEDWRALLDTYDGDRMLVGEVFLYDVPRVARYVGPTRLHQAFNFTVMRTPWGAAALRETVEAALEHFHPGTWVLSNHDLVRHVTRYGGGPLGRRRGLAVSAALFGLPGSPYLYQGEELGLDEADVPPGRRQDPVWRRTGGERPGRDGCRTPIPWVGDAPGLGFTTGEPWLPFGDDAAELAVDRQERDPGSTLAAYRELLALRRSLLAEGLPQEVTLLDTVADVLGYRRGRLTVLLNTSEVAVEMAVSAEAQVSAGVSVSAGVPVGAAVAAGGAVRDVGAGGSAGLSSGRTVAPPASLSVVAATASGAAVRGGVVTVPGACTVWLLVE